MWIEVAISDRLKAASVASRQQSGKIVEDALLAWLPRIEQDPRGLGDWKAPRGRRG